MPLSEKRETQQQQQQQTQQSQTQSRPAAAPLCRECGDVDGDVTSGSVLCRRCSDAAVATLACTD
jgi:hypothetical protein